MSNVDQKMEELLFALEYKSEHQFVHINGDCNLTHFGYCFKHVKVDGLWMEFGVFQGKTISTIAGCNPDKTIFGFDSFEGLPEFWNAENPKGLFSLDGQIPAKINRGPEVFQGDQYQDWNENIILIKGLFNDTLPRFIEEHPEPVAFMHVDSDLYSSCKTILEIFKNQIVSGTIICFDEWCGYPRNVNLDEVKAFAEFLLETGLEIEPISHQTDPRYSQAGVKIL
jgi:hypothetical protein